MQTNEVLKRLRVEKQMTQDEMAEKLFVTRQAVSRWETGDDAKRGNAQTAFDIV